MLSDRRECQCGAEEVTLRTWARVEGTYALDYFVKYRCETTHVGDGENRVQQLSLPAVMVAFKERSVVAGVA